MLEWKNLIHLFSYSPWFDLRSLSVWLNVGFLDERNAHVLKDLCEVISLSRAVVPVIQGYEDAGDFTLKERLKTSAHVNLIYYLCVGSIALCGVILLIILHKDWFVPFSPKR